MESLIYLETSLFRVNQNTCALPFHSLSLSVRDTFSVAICFVRFYIYVYRLVLLIIPFFFALILIVAFC